MQILPDGERVLSVIDEPVDPRSQAEASEAGVLLKQVGQDSARKHSRHSVAQIDDGVSFDEIALEPLWDQGIDRTRAVPWDDQASIGMPQRHLVRLVLGPRFMGPNHKL